MNYKQEIIDILSNYSHTGLKKLDNGTTLIGVAHHISKEAWLHCLYAPINEEKIKILENKIGIEFPIVFKDFLNTFNGLTLFVDTFNILGYRDNYKRDIEANIQPYDILTDNLHEKPKDSNNHQLFIGGYDWDGSNLYIDTKSLKVYRCNRETTNPINEWSSFEEMILSELKRLVKLFDNNGVPFNSQTPTTP